MDSMLKALCECDDVKKYKRLNEQIRAIPEKKNRLMEFRRKNFLLQNAKEGIDVFTETVRLKKEYEDLFRDPLTADFLAAEVAVCRIVQLVTREIISCLDFEPVLSEE